MSLIAMAVYSTEENNKDECLEKTLRSLRETVNFRKHRLMLCVNGHTDRTLEILKNQHITSGIIFNETNLGTAAAINQAWKERGKGEAAIKMDDDVVFHQEGWADQMEDCIARDNQIGIIGLKRRDLIQTTWHNDPHFKSYVQMLPHTPGQIWRYVERTEDVMGTCTMYNSQLLDKIGYLKQINRYGYDDNISCHRSHLSGFYNCFLIGVDIEHIDEGGTPYQTWKEKHAGECTERFIKLVHDMIQGREPIYYNPFK